MLIRVFKKDRVYGYDFRIKETLHYQIGNSYAKPFSQKCPLKTF